MRELRPVTRRAITTGAGAALGLVLVAAWLAWWAPTIALMAARLMLGRLRFRLAFGLGAALCEVGAVGLARRLYAAEIRRAERRQKALAGRPRPDAR